jgi:hypothetical protein
MTDARREILFEVRQTGQALRVAAIDARTGTEVAVTGPATGGLEPLKQLALRKLHRALARLASP